MATLSPLGLVVSSLITARENARAYADLLAANEASTRIVLIDPLIRCLGWDPSRPDQVDVERYAKFHDKNCCADYVLLSSGEPCVVVEAKRLGSDLTSPDQALMYSQAFCCPKVLVTDGVHWVFFSNFQPPVRETWRFDIRDRQASLVDCASKLVDILDSARYLEQESTDEELREIRDRLDEVERKLSEGEVASRLREREALPAEPPDVDDHLFMPLDQLTAVDVTHKHPEELIMPDGRRERVRAWSSLLIGLCRYVLDHNGTLPLPFADAAKGKTSLISYSPPAQHLTQGEHSHNGKTVYIYANYSAIECVRNAVRVIGAGGITVMPQVKIRER